MKNISKYSSIFLMSLFFSPVALAQSYEGGYGGHMMGGWYGWFLGPLMMIFWIGLGVAVIVFVIRMVGGDEHRQLHRRMRDHKGILKARYARGDISREEYLEMKKLLDED
ncbi:MAG: SHOCT domain-containing protein [Kordiimonadaceae bacterium]|nr:SHOCT domain-containing protein [Kordiimonadaceae bacterium]